MLRDRLVRELKKVTSKKSGDEGPVYVSSWPYYNIISFLGPTVKHRRYVTYIYWIAGLNGFAIIVITGLIAISVCQNTLVRRPLGQIPLLQMPLKWQSLLQYQRSMKFIFLS